MDSVATFGPMARNHLQEHIQAAVEQFVNADAEALEHNLRKAMWLTPLDRWPRIVIIECDGLPRTVACLVEPPV